MARLVATLLELPQVGAIILSNNNPAVDILDYLPMDQINHPSLEIIQQNSPTVCAKRFEIAASVEHSHFICPDDDIFLSVEQYHCVLNTYASAQSQVVGIRGQLLVYKSGSPVLMSGFSGVDAELDVLNCFYVFSKQHIAKYVQLMQDLNIAGFDDLEFIDDLFVSHCGNGRPLCVDVGAITFCDTQDEPGIATWQEPGFMPRRLEYYNKLKNSYLMGNK